MARKKHTFVPPSSANPEEKRSCSAPGCTEEGIYKARKSPKEMEAYIYFCLDHVKAHHALWNYYAHMSAEEVHRENDADITWHRPSRPFGGLYGMMPNKLREALFTFMNEEYASLKTTTALPQKIQDILVLFEITYPFSLALLKKKYYKLAKTFHPDVNQDPGAAAQFQRIKEGFHILKTMASALEKDTSK